MPRSCRLRIPGIVLIAVMGPAFAFAQGPSDNAASAPSQNEKAARCDQYGFSTVFSCIWNDVRHLGRRRSLAWLASGGVLSAGSLLLDDEVLQSFSDEDQNAAIVVGDNLGGAGLHFGAAAALYAIARARGDTEMASLGVTLIRVQVVNAAVTRGLKLVPRARPYQESATFAKGSFPSGHTSATFATATVIKRRWGWRAGVPAYVIASYVGITRLHNVHYLSDVTFGAAVGIASGLAVNIPGPLAEISPLIAPGVAGVAIGIR